LRRLPDMIKITSTQNPRILNLMRLSKPLKRKEANLFIIEGYREISRAVGSGKFPITSVYYCPEIITGQGKNLLNTFPSPVEMFEVNRHVYEKIAYRDNKDGIIVLATPVMRALRDYQPEQPALILVMETVEKPGNLGAIIRTADAAGVDAVLVCDPGTDIYNPNVIRSSLGCIFTVTVISCSSEEAIRFLHENHIKIFTASLQADTIYTSGRPHCPGSHCPGLRGRGTDRPLGQECGYRGKNTHGRRGRLTKCFRERRHPRFRGGKAKKGEKQPAFFLKCHKK
jgi:RNA methyltransferase, TrmH family